MTLQAAWTRPEELWCLGHRLFIFEAEFNEKEMTLKSSSILRQMQEYLK